MNTDMIVAGGAVVLTLLGATRKKPEIVQATTGGVISKTPGDVILDKWEPVPIAEPDLTLIAPPSDFFEYSGAGASSMDTDTANNQGSVVGQGLVSALGHAIVSGLSALTGNLFGNLANTVHKGINKGMQSLTDQESVQSMVTLSGLGGGVSGGSPGNAGTSGIGPAGPDAPGEAGY